MDAIGQALGFGLGVLAIATASEQALWVRRYTPLLACTGVHLSVVGALTNPPCSVPYPRRSFRSHTILESCQKMGASPRYRRLRMIKHHQLERQVRPRPRQRGGGCTATAFSLAWAGWEFYSSWRYADGAHRYQSISAHAS
jgi:hypothetical protein